MPAVPAIPAVLGLVLVLLPACASPSTRRAAQDPPPRQDPQGGAQQQERTPFEPPAPDPKDFDWIMLTSGEWLKGDIESLRSEQLEFDSKELDKLTFDWDDVAVLRSPRQNTIVLSDLETVTGTVLVRDGEVVVLTAAGERRFARDRLLSMIPGDSASGPRWTGDLSLGIAVQSGNTDQQSLNTVIHLRRSAPLSRVTFDYIGNYGEIDGTTNIENNRITAEWDLFTSERWYVTPLALTMYRDPFQNIALQAIPGAGFGYRALDQPKVKWNVSLQGGWRYTRFDSVTGSSSENESTAQITPTTRLEWDITDKFEYFLNYQLGIGVPDTRDTNQHLVTGVSVDVIGDLDLDVTLQWDRIGNPETDASGNIPKKDDFRLSVGFGFSF